VSKNYLIIDSRPYGLFSNFLHTIDNIKWAEDNNYIPVVRWGPGRRDANLNRPGAQKASELANPKHVGDNPNFVKKEDEVEQCLYWSEQGWNDSKNPWEYYFEPLNKHTIEEALSSDHEISDIFQVGFHDLRVSSLEKKFLIFNLHSYTPLNTWGYFYSDVKFKKHRTEVQEYVKKLKVKDEIKEIVDSFVKEKFSKNVLGVHIRATDKISESKIGQRPQVQLEDYLYEIEQYLKINSKADIFVASDNNESIREIIRRFPNNKVLMSKCTRMQRYSDKIPLHLSSFAGPQAGEEALIDCLLLSECSHILCTDSNLAAAALYFNAEPTCTFINKFVGRGR